MKKILALMIFCAFDILIYAQTGNVGINTTTPGTTLDVNGAITNRETLVVIATNSANIPSNVSQVQLTGTATASITVSAPAAPNAGQRLIIYNNTTGGFSAILNGFSIPNGQLMEFSYSNGSWRSTIGGASALGTNWNILGNSATNPSTNFLGTTDSQHLVFKTNNTEKMRVESGGNVGIGTTTPASKLHIEGTETRFSNATSIWSINPESPSNILSFIDRINNVRRLVLLSSGDAFMGGAIGSTGANATISAVGGNAGIGVTTPTAKLDVNGTVRIRTVPMLPGASIATPIYQDANGNIVKSSPLGQGDVMSTTTAVVAGGATIAALTNVPDGGAYTLYVSTGDGCAQIAIADFWVIASDSNANNALMGKNGMLSKSGVVPPSFSETQNSSSVTWNGAQGCSDGGNTNSLNFRALITPGPNHQIQITNNGNVGRVYNVILTRVGGI